MKLLQTNVWGTNVCFLGFCGTESASLVRRYKLFSSCYLWLTHNVMLDNWNVPRGWKRYETWARWNGPISNIVSLQRMFKSNWVNSNHAIVWLLGILLSPADKLIPKVSEFPQKSTPWLSSRRGRMTGSILAGTVGHSPYDRPWKVVREACMLSTWA